MHVQAAVIQGQFAAQRQLCQFLFVHRFARLAQQRLQQAAFGKRQRNVMLADTGYAGYLGQEFIPAGDPVAALRSAFELCKL